MKNTYALTKRRAYESANRKALREDAAEFVVMIALKGPDGKAYDVIGYADKDTDIDYEQGVYGYDADIRDYVYPMTRNDATKLAAEIIENAPAGDCIVGVVPYSTIPQGGGFEAEPPSEDEPTEEDMEIPGSDDVETSEEDTSEEESAEEEEEEPVEESVKRPYRRGRRVTEDDFSKKGAEIDRSGTVLKKKADGTFATPSKDSPFTGAAKAVAKKVKAENPELYNDMTAKNDDKADIRAKRNIEFGEPGDYAVYKDGDEEAADTYKVTKEDITNMMESRSKKARSKVLENMRRRMR